MNASQKTTIQSTKLKKGNDSVISPKLMLSHLFVGAFCFYWGLVGAQTTLRNHAQIDCTSDVINPERKPMLAKIKKQAERIQALTEQLNEKAGQRVGRREEAADDTESRFPQTMSSFMGGMATVDRAAFAKRFDVGVPLDQGSPSNSEVLLVYSHPDAAPASDSFKGDESLSNTRIPQFDDIEVATENCDLLNLILTQPNDKRQCFAFMGQYRSYHIFKFMRLPGQQGQRLDQSSPLRLVNRGSQTSGRVSAKVPKKAQTATYWKTLTTYLQNLDSTLEALKPVAERAAAGNPRGAIVVMVCNHGQSELLMNFACASRARGLNITSVLVFATDEETKELAEGLGMNVFFDEKSYGHIPKIAAGRYADRTFTAVMMAKVYCVQMTMMLDYDVLFQDVDVVWYKNPLEFFQDDSTSMYNFDIYFQDDGSRGLFYAPYSANTGVYYVRNNDKTRHFFNSLLLSGDLVESTRSHQIALVSMLNEHASLFNLKVKILSRDMEEFPGGYTFHRRHDYMRDLFRGKVDSYLFHMSWTENKNNKQKFFKQMGSWYLQDKCVATTVETILRKDQSIKKPAGNASIGYLLEPCCSAEPLISCFYRDKPSIIPCKDSPNLDQGKKSFW